MMAVQGLMGSEMLAEEDLLGVLAVAVAALVLLAGIVAIQM